MSSELNQSQRAYAHQHQHHHHQHHHHRDSLMSDYQIESPYPNNIPSLHQNNRHPTHSHSHSHPHPHPHHHHQPTLTHRRSLQARDHHRDWEPSSTSRLNSEPQTAISTLSTDLDHNDHHPQTNYSHPNAHKIYIGGLPELTRLEDLQDCFSQLGPIKNIELKNGYGFVEYDSTQAASDAVSKYHEGTFLGSQIRVEISHGGSRPRHVAVANNPEACYTCGIAGHWARDCPDAESSVYSRRRLRPRSRSPPPRPREHPYDRPPRPDYDPPPRDYFRRRTPPLEPPYARPERDRLPVGRGGGYLPELIDDKRHRPDHARAPLDAPGLRTRSREPYGLPGPPLGPPLAGPRDYYADYREYGYRMGPPEAYPPHALPPGRDMYDERLGGYLVKAYPPEPGYHREPFEGPLSGPRYPDRPPYEGRPRYMDHRPGVIHADRREDTIGPPGRRGPPMRDHRSPRRNGGGGPRRSLSPHGARRGGGPAAEQRKHSHRLQERGEDEHVDGGMAGVERGGGREGGRGGRAGGGGRDSGAGDGGYGRGGAARGGMRR